jgi:hypothetical protein
MKLSVSGLQGTGFIEVTAEHRTQTRVWTTGKAFSKVRLNDPNRIFEEINAYWEYMGPEVQQNVWECYVKIRDVMDMSMDSMRVALTLRHYIKEMFTYMPMDTFRRWLMTVGNIHIPLDIESVITSESRYNKPEQTYLRHDYINLAAVSLAERPLVPIWGEYIDQGSDQELYKENEVVGLIDDCEMANWPVGEVGPDGKEVETVFEKLAAYVRFCVEDEPTTLGSLWRGMSSVEIPVHLQSKVLVRRLTIIPLNDPTHHSMVSNIYRYIDSNLSPTERSTSDRVNEKRPEGGGGDDEDKTSFIEAHKTKQRISPGDIVAFTLDANDAEKLTRKVDPTLDFALLHECMGEVNNMAQSADVFPHQVLLAQWVMAKAYPARAFPHIPKLSVHKLLAQAQALLWHWKFLDLAVFLQVGLFQQGDHMSVNQLNQPRMATRIPAKYKDEMQALYPHERQQRMQQNGVQAEPMNMAGIAINDLNASIRASHWVYGGPDRLFKESGQVTANKVLIPPNNIKATITELVLHLGKLNS